MLLAQVLEMLVHRLHGLKDPLNSALTLQVRNVSHSYSETAQVTSACLAPSKSCASILTNNNVQELSIRGGYFGISFWEEIFQDHSGTDLWLPLAQSCLGELRALTAAADQYLEAHGKHR